MFFAGQLPTSRQLNTIINSRDLYLSPSFVCNTTVYANFPGGTLQFEKLMPAAKSDIRVWLFCSAFLTALPARNVTLGINVLGVDFDITYYRFNEAQVHFAWSRPRRFTGFNSGTFLIQLRAKVDGAGSIEFQGVGSGGQISLIVEEILL